MTARWLAFGLWAAAAASAAYWGLRIFVPAALAPAHADVVATANAPRGDLSRLFGVDAPAAVEAAAPEASRFELLGVVAPKAVAAVREGVALIAVDGKPARAYRVGAVIDGDNVLQSVRARGASIGPRDGAALVSLDIPPPMAATTGTLPAAGDFGTGGGFVPPAAQQPRPGVRPFNPAVRLAPGLPVGQAPGLQRPQVMAPDGQGGGIRGEPVSE